MKTLFEIPVYSLKKEDFEKRLEVEAKKQFKHSELMNPMLSREYIWRFNQIIGYIVISIDNKKQDIVFEVYKHLGRIYPLSLKKKNIINLNCTGLHFRYTNLSNEEIVDKMKIMISDINNQYFTNRYVELQMFTNVVSHIDFSKL